MDTATQLTMLAPLARGLAGGASATRPEVNLRSKASEPELTSSGIEKAIEEIDAMTKDRTAVINKGSKPKVVFGKPFVPAPIDPYAVVKAGWAVGKTIEVKFPGDPKWMPWKFDDEPTWTNDPKCYRIKPELDLDAMLANGAKVLARVTKAGEGVGAALGVTSGHQYKVGTLVNLSKGGPGGSDYQADTLNGKHTQWLFREEFELVNQA